jgi:copper homeostasis protein
MPTPSRVVLEIAVDNAPDAIAAVEAGADRLELVASLDQHGLTPPVELVREVKAAVGPVPIMAMVRSHPGSFEATPRSVAFAMRDAENVLEAGADGIVFGMLTPAGHIDRGAVAMLVETAHGRPTCFHRAFDLCTDPEGSLRALMDRGVTRVLSAGFDVRATAAALGLDHDPAPDVVSGASLPIRLRRLKSFVEIAGDRLEIVPCGGVRSANAQEFLRGTDLCQLHSACRVNGQTRLSRDEATALRRAADGE